MRTASLILTLCPIFMAVAQDPGFPKPTAHHLSMKKAEGTWDAVVKVQMGPGKPPMESKAVEVNKVVPGGLWLQSEFSSDMGGVPFEGRGLFGYDPATGKHVGTWVDSMVVTQAITEGTCKGDCREITSTFTGPGMDGKPAKFKEVSVQVDDDHRTMALYIQDKAGKFVLNMEIAYVRRK